MVFLESQVIEQTNKWIKSVVIDCNFCPFAAKALLKKSIHYTVVESPSMKHSLTIFLEELDYLTAHDDVETSFIIFPINYTDFSSYLALVKKAEQLLTKTNHDGIYQVASFHPDYCFSGSTNDDPANYTNRSIYPMLHILREESLTTALKLFPNPEKIPEHNMAYARQKGLNYMQLLRAACMT